MTKYLRPNKFVVIINSNEYSESVVITAYIHKCFVPWGPNLKKELNQNKYIII